MHFLLTKKLKYFMTVMEEGCLAKACEYLYITRSPLGKTINELEELLGEKLFLREHGMYQPTQFAREVYEQTLPVYQKLINLEHHLIHSESNRYIHVVLDSAFPENIADVILSRLKRSDFSLKLTRKKVCQDDLDALSPGPDVLIISNSELVVDEHIEATHYLSSPFLVVANQSIKHDASCLTALPILVRHSLPGLIVSRVTRELQQSLGFTPKARYVEGNLVDCLLLMGSGNGFMMLPLKTCELMNINRENTFLLDNMKIKVNYYFRKKGGCKQNINDVVKYINTLF